MTPLRFEQLYSAEWDELEALLGDIANRHPPARLSVSGASASRIPALYRRACEHLALARARSYPADIVDRLERMTATAHQAIYYRRDYGLARVRRVAAVEFPSTARALRGYVAAATATFLLPALVVGLLVYMRPDTILSVVSAETATSFEAMYSPETDTIGRDREAATDWLMFGFYIRNNITVAFQCFAGGLFAGIGALFFLAYNGAFSGAIAGYLTERGLSSTFYAFVATHSSFELTAIVLSGAAGLRIGHSLVAPGRKPRLQSLMHATRDSAVLLYGVTLMLVIAAVIEAFWSSAGWLPAGVKYGTAGVAWTAVIAYFTYQGRHEG